MVHGIKESDSANLNGCGTYRGGVGLHPRTSSCLQTCFSGALLHLPWLFHFRYRWLFRSWKKLLLKNTWHHSNCNSRPVLLSFSDFPVYFVDSQSGHRPAEVDS